MTTALESWAVAKLAGTLVDYITVAQTPWSHVVRITTDQGVFYAKATVPTLYNETSTIQLLRNVCGAMTVPDIMAQDDDRSFILMRACGDSSLREAFAGEINEALMLAGIQSYRHLIGLTPSHLDVFKKAGVPDWRIAAYPALFDAFFSDRDFLLQQGLARDEISRAYNLAPALVSAVEAIGRYPIPAVLGHNDINENNMLVNRANGAVSIIDLGESAIEHPWSSLTWLLGRLFFRYKLDKGGDTYRQLWVACFDGWGVAEGTARHLHGLFETITPFYSLLGERRLIVASGAERPEVMERLGGRIRTSTLRLIDSLEKA